MKQLHIAIPIRFFILYLTFTLSTFPLHAQEKPKTYDLKITDATLEEFVRTVEKLTGLSFVYGEEVKLARNISLDVKQKTIDELLQTAFTSQPVKYKVSGKHILLQKKEIQPKPSGRKYTINGYITDAESSEVLIGANAYESLRRQGTSTNPYGFYTLTLPEGEAELTFSYLGYANTLRKFNLTKDTVINVRMTSNILLEEVVVMADRVETGILATHTGSIDIPMPQVQNTPSILGEPDVMKLIQTMPGVQAGVEGSAGLYVRGGGPDQNLILLDGVPIYNVDHLMGFFSIFTPEAMKKVTLFKSSFPARFGGRLSSVVDVRTNDGDMKNYHGAISIGLLASKLNFEGPIVKNKTAFNLSMRRSYIDLVTYPFMADDWKIRYYFYDINAKVNHKFSDKHRLFLSFYNGTDYLKSEDYWDNGYNGMENMSKEKAANRWGNTVVALRWNNIINNKLFSNTTVAFNQYKLTMDSKSKYTYGKDFNSYHTKYGSQIRDLSAQVDFDYTPAPEHHIKFGGNYTFHKFNPEVTSSKVLEITEESRTDTIYKGLSDNRMDAHEVFIYGEDNFDITPKLRVNAGLHLSAFHVQDKTYFSLQPRLAGRYQLNRDVVLKASYSKMNQYINLLTSAPISLPTDLWVPVTRNVRPMRAHQYALGGYYTGVPGWEFSVEGYFKDMRNVLEYKDATRFIGSSSSWEDKVEMGKGRSFGIELMAQRTVGKTTGWLSYTLAKSDRKFSKGGISNGERFPFKYDRRHTVNLVLNHKFSDRIDVGASWFFASGATATIPYEVTAVGVPGDAVIDIPYVEHRNNYRLPPSHRLNVGINFHKKKKHGTRTWNFSIYNTYNAMNPTFVQREIRYNQESGDEDFVLKKFTLLPLIPSVTYTYRF